MKTLARDFRRAALVSVLLGGATLATPTMAASVAQEAQALISSGKAAEALSTLDSHLAKRPEDAEARFARGLALVKLDRSKDAIRAFADLTRDYPQLPEPYNNLAVLYASQGEYEKARDALKAAVGRHPGYAVAHENLGDIYAALASIAYNKVIALDPGNRTARGKIAALKQIDSGLAVASAPAASAAVAAPAAAAVAAAAPVMAPAAVAAPSSQSGPGDNARHDAGLAAVQSWAGAWANKDFDAYFAAYAPEFTPEGGLTRETWEAQRRDRIARPKQIKVGVVAPKVTDIEDGALRVEFRQTYQSDAFVDTTDKVLELVPVNGGWKIVREYAR